MAEEEFLPLNTAEQDSDTSWYKATAAGIASGILKIPEGIVSVAADLIDLGADTDTAASVEEFFDKLNPFEEVAEERAIGKLTEALIQIGVPGTMGFKIARGMATRALAGKKAGRSLKKSKATMAALNKAADLNDKNGYKRFAAAVMGGAAGEAFVADIDQIGTFGDMFESGPTQLNDDPDLVGREEAARSLMNRFKFGSESILLTPFVYGVGKSAKMLANQGKELAYSNSKFARWLDKYVRAPFSPKGALTDELFDSERLKEALKGKDINRAKEIVDNITKETDKMFPELKTMFDQSTRGEKADFMKRLNEILFEGDLRGKINVKEISNLIKQMKITNVPKDSRINLVNSLNNARKEMTDLMDILDANTTGVKLNKGAAELKALLKDRVNNWIGSTYKIFEDQGGMFKFFKRYTPTAEANRNAVNFFRVELAKKAGDVGFDPAINKTKYKVQAQNEVDRLIQMVSKKKRPTSLELKDYINRSMEGRAGEEFIRNAMKDTNLPPKFIRELLGEVSDPRYSIFNAMTNLSTVARTSSYLNEIAAKNAQVLDEGGRGFFWKNADDGAKAVNQFETGIELVKINDQLAKIKGMKSIVSPFGAETVTTKEIAEAILNANNVASGLQGFVRGEGKEGAEAAVSWMYRNLLLFPKGVSQMAKTIFSIPTHLRNMFSAIGFSGANGILFENPKILARAFKEGIDVSGLLKLGPNHPRAQRAYREMLELGLVNQQVQIGDIKNMFRDIKFGEQVYNVDSILRPFMARMKKLGAFFQGKYVAEDDTFKITNYVVELDRLKTQVGKGRKVNRELLRYIPEEQLNIKYKNARTDGFKGTYDEFLDQYALKQEAANIVKNTVPNYAFVGSAVRTARLLPIGNFMSFPSEMIRTTGNIVELGLNEMRHSKPTIGSNVLPVVMEKSGKIVKNNNVAWGTGFKRLTGMATFTTAGPIALVEGAKAMYDVSEEELQALRRFVPEWSKNSTLIPTRAEDGTLRYTDFSHSNAYDVISRPFRTLLNNIQDGQASDQQLLASFVNGLGEAGSEIMNPFVSESIWTEAMADLTVRGGITQDGRRLYTDQTSAGDKAAIRFMHLGQALAPSYKQFQRIGQAAFGTPDKRGEILDIGPELAGFMGLRAIKVDPLKSMGFKIVNYQKGIRDARREFTGGFFGLLKGGIVDPNDIIERFYKSNRARFFVQQEMFKDINAALALDVNSFDLEDQFKERQISQTAFNDLFDGVFQPYTPSQDIQDKFADIAQNLGENNPFYEAENEIYRMADEMANLSLDGQFNINLEEYLEKELPIPPLPENVTSAMPNQSVITQGQNILNNNLQTNASGLTATEEAYLSDEEKLIRRRSRGTIV
tara:strand:- start:9052 stop:13101 length:4050 start_codon:yes stop_codon:yes gene_type:complete